MMATESTWRRHLRPMICNCGRNGMAPHEHNLPNGCPHEPVEDNLILGLDGVNVLVPPMSATAEPRPDHPVNVSPSDDEPESDEEAVEHPVHYFGAAQCPSCSRPIECIDVTAHMNFPVGSAVKYLWRLDLKGDPIEQLRKARQFIDFEIARRERNSS